MVFDRCYDETLWLMLRKDSDKRNLIAEFIKSVPEELCSQIRASIVYYQNNLSNNNSFSEEDEYRLSGEIRISGDMLYWYMINPQTGALNLGEAIDDGEEQYDMFQMTLYPLKTKCIMEMENLDDCLLGDIAYDYVEEYACEQLCVIDCESTEFHLIKLPFGKMLINSCEYFPYVKNRYGLVNIEKIPCNYNVSDLRDRDSLNRLVRRRRNFK